MDNKVEIKEERVPVGIISMLLAGYVSTIKRLTWALIISVICLLFSWVGFWYYLSNYEVEVTTYGTFENSRVNTSRGKFNEKVDTFNNNNYNYGVGENENKK